MLTSQQVRNSASTTSYEVLPFFKEGIIEWYSPLSLKFKEDEDLIRDLQTGTKSFKMLVAHRNGGDILVPLRDKDSIPKKDLPYFEYKTFQRYVKNEDYQKTQEYNLYKISQYLEIYGEYLLSTGESLFSDYFKLFFKHMRNLEAQVKEYYSL